MVEAVEALRGVLWEALLDQLSRPIFDRSSARLLGDVADRLAYVCAAVLAAAVDAVLAPGARAPLHEAEVAVGVPEPTVRDFARVPPPAAPGGHRRRTRVRGPACGSRAGGRTHAGDRAVA